MFSLICRPLFYIVNFRNVSYGPVLVNVSLKWSTLKLQIKQKVIKTRFQIFAVGVEGYMHHMHFTYQTSVRECEALRYFVAEIQSKM